MDTRDLRKMIERVDLDGIDKILRKTPLLANTALPVDEHNPAMAHPLHRICDGVFAGTYRDSDAAAIARIFLNHGADVNGNVPMEMGDTPLIAAASLRADEVALLYIESGAAINHAGTHGGTALHWSAWCGRDLVVSALLEAHAEINKYCFDFKATPLGWAVHGYKFGGPDNRYRQDRCIRLLVEAGADVNLPNREGIRPVDMLENTDADLKNILGGK